MASLPPITEAAFLRQILEMAKLFGWLTWHQRPARTKHGWRSAVQGSGVGFPDVVAAHPGRRLLLFRELKTDRGQLTAAQVAWLDALRAAGADVAVWRPSAFPEIEKTLRGDP